MRVPDRCLGDLRERGYLVFEGFLAADELAVAQEALWLRYPRPDERTYDAVVAGSVGCGFDAASGGGG